MSRPICTECSCSKDLHVDSKDSSATFEMEGALNTLFSTKPQKHFQALCKMFYVQLSLHTYTICELVGNDSMSGGQLKVDIPLALWFRALDKREYMMIIRDNFC